MRTAQMTSSIARLVATFGALTVIGFSGTANAAPPPPPPPVSAAPVGNAPPPPQGATPPAAAPTDSAPAPLAPPPPPPAPQQTTPPAPKPKLSTMRWDDRPPPIAWHTADNSMPPMWPARLEYEEGDVVPPGYQLKSNPDRGLLTGGLITLLVPYSLSFLAGAAFVINGNDTSRKEFGALLVPAVGPFIALGVWDSTSEESAFLMLANGFAQTAGAAMIVTSILMPEKTLQRMGSLPGKPEVFVGPASASLRLRF